MFFLLQFCDVILQEQKDKQVNETHQLPSWKMKLVHNDLLCIWSADEQQIRQTQCSKLFIVTYQSTCGLVLAREVLHRLQPLERNKYEYIQVEFDTGGRELVSSCGKMKSFTRS